MQVCGGYGVADLQGDNSLLALLAYAEGGLGRGGRGALAQVVL